MHTTSAASRAGARAVSGPAPRRRLTVSPADRLDQLSMQLDELIRDIRFTPDARSHRELERRIAEAEEIAGGIRAVFRGDAQPQHKPLWQGDGKAMW